MQNALNSMLVAITDMQSAVRAMQAAHTPDRAPPVQSEAPIEVKQAVVQTVDVTELTYADVHKAGTDLFQAHGRDALMTVAKQLGIKALKETPAARFGEALLAIAALSKTLSAKAA